MHLKRDFLFFLYIYLRIEEEYEIARTLWITWALIYYTHIYVLEIKRKLEVIYLHQKVKQI
jgi:hypothetical protein